MNEGMEILEDDDYMLFSSAFDGSELPIPEVFVPWA